MKANKTQDNRRAPAADSGRNERKKRNLRSTLVEPFKQLKLGLYVMLISVAFLIAAAVLFVSAFTEQYKHVMEIFNVVDPKTKWELVTNDIFYHNAIKLGILFLSFISLLFTIVFKMTHKIYGPLVSIERFVDQIAEGQYDRRVIIRRGDELGRLADRLNAMAEHLQKKHGFPDRRKGEGSGSSSSHSQSPKAS